MTPLLVTASLGVTSDGDLQAGNDADGLRIESSSKFFSDVGCISVKEGAGVNRSVLMLGV